MSGSPKKLFQNTSSFYLMAPLSSTVVPEVSRPVCIQPTEGESVGGMELSHMTTPTCRGGWGIWPSHVSPFAPCCLHWEQICYLGSWNCQGSVCREIALCVAVGHRASRGQAFGLLFLMPLSPWWALLSPILEIQVREGNSLRLPTFWHAGNRSGLRSV